MNLNLKHIYMTPDLWSLLSRKQCVQHALNNVFIFRVMYAFSISVRTYIVFFQCGW